MLQVKHHFDGGGYAAGDVHSDWSVCESQNCVYCVQTMLQVRHHFDGAARSQEALPASF